MLNGTRKRTNCRLSRSTVRNGFWGLLFTITMVATGCGGDDDTSQNGLVDATDSTMADAGMDSGLDGLEDAGSDTNGDLSSDPFETGADDVGPDGSMDSGADQIGHKSAPLKEARATTW